MAPNPSYPAAWHMVTAPACAGMPAGSISPYLPDDETRRDLAAEATRGTGQAETPSGRPLLTYERTKQASAGGLMAIRYGSGVPDPRRLGESQDPPAFWNPGTPRYGKGKRVGGQDSGSATTDLHSPFAGQASVDGLGKEVGEVSPQPWTRPGKAMVNMRKVDEIALALYGAQIAQAALEMVHVENQHHAHYAIGLVKSRTEMAERFVNDLRKRMEAEAKGEA